MTREEASGLLDALAEAEGIIAECDRMMRTTSPGSIDRLRVSSAGGDIFVRPADLRPLAKWAAEDIVAQLRGAGYIVPGDGR